MSLGVVHPLVILYGGGTGLSCAANGSLHAEELHGLFAADTRVLSTYRIMIAGCSWQLLARSRPGASSAQWDMQNPAMVVPDGNLEEGCIHLRVRRRLMGALHEDVAITSFREAPVRVRLSFQLDADFADVFQVKDQTMAPRLSVGRSYRDRSMSLVYERSGFQRGLHVRFEASSAPTFVGAQAIFDVVLDPQRPWRCCIEAVPEVDGRRLEFQGDPHASYAVSDGICKPSVECEPLLAEPFVQGCVDLERLAIPDGLLCERRPSGGLLDGLLCERRPSGGLLDSPFIAAGAPWFLTLFGRDTLITSLMAAMVGPWHTKGSLLALGKTQARSRDDFGDAEPGKIAHELRRGELARFRSIPHTPYYGTHDAPALYVLALWNGFRWTGDGSLLERHLATAEAALRWCDEYGDQDGDGLLEYRTRSKKGYRNQGWKDAGDAIVHEDGRHAELPIATVELQGYWYAARLAMAEMLELTGKAEGAAEHRRAAQRLRALVEERYWMEDQGFYALALDGRKHVVQSISSNPGHLLWCGLPSMERARRVARRLLEGDMYSGYGVRTLSAQHRSFNPLSYQLGSVWPHDNALIAAGLMRYGLCDEAARILKGILDAAALFDEHRLPELFCGFARDDGPPVPYAKANVPQAWSAAAPLLTVQLFVGLLPNVPNGKCYLSPWLPEWLTTLNLRGVVLGNGELSARVRRTDSGTRVEEAHHPELEVVVGSPQAPLWGRPLSE